MVEVIDWKEINETESVDGLRKAKLWLFQENVRLANERRELEQSQEEFQNERVRLRKEMDELSRKNLMERDRLKEENLFFDKKLAILQDGFRKLDEDRQDLERQRRELAQERSERMRKPALGGPVMEETVQLLFRGVDNSLALRKRYRDLVKIFHPDNLFGDGELAQMINREYLKRKDSE